jgi:hypothetical protein
MWLKVMHFSPVLHETLKISRRLGRRGKRVLCRGFASLCWYENNLSGKMNMAGGFAVAAFALLLVAVNQKCICLLQLDETPHVKGKAYGAHVLAEPSFWTLRRTATETHCRSVFPCKQCQIKPITCFGMFAMLLIV